MVIIRPPSRLILAVLLLQATLPGLAESRWECDQGTGAVWECTSKVEPASTLQQTSDKGKDSMPVDRAASPLTPVDSGPEAGADVDTGPTDPARSSTDTLPADTQADTTGPDGTQPAEPLQAPEPATQPAEPLQMPEPATQPAEPLQVPEPATQPAEPLQVGEPAMQPADAPADSMPVTDDAAPVSDEALQVPAGTAASAASVTPEPGRERWSQCPPSPVPEHLAGIDDPESVDLQADNIQASKERVFTLSGDAVIRYGEQQLSAGNITYKRASGELEAAEGVRFAGPTLVVSADSANIETEAERGRLENIAFTLPGQHARGKASALGFEGPARQYLEKASYTTCPPGNRDWELSAKKIELDQADGTGVARNAKVTFKSVPLLYTPYISFPLDDRRKSGLLFPKIGTTDETGLDVSLPWYWNISPNRDLTLTPRVMSDRGVMIGGEFRYLNRRSAGSVKAEYLPNDKEFTNQDRSLVTVSHRGNPVPRLSTRIEASNVSDTSYFEDLGNTLVQTSQTSLERTAEATWHSDSWQAGIVVQDFQNIDATLASADRPYKQLPQLVFSATPHQRFLGIQASAEAELNYFTHSDNTLVTGSRLDVMPRFSAPVKRPGWYIEPAVAVRHTAYQLDNVSAGIPDNPTRTLPVATLDMGTFFERNGHWGNRPYIQTLEPRLFYLYIPHKDQDDLPVFDTENYDQNFWSLFRENRFSGPDRLGDANQLVVALTTRIINPASGRQMMSARLGSLLYFRDRTVTLPGEVVATDSSSDLIGELAVALSRRWSAHGEVHWNPHSSESIRNNYQVQYLAGPRRLVNLGYRFRDGTQEQADISFLWPLSRAWHAVGRWYYDMDNSETIEALAGLGYERCCWGIQVLARSHINSDDLQRNNAVFIQLELKGLGKLGSSVDDALERGILGYRP